MTMPQGAKAYYSKDTALDASNYQTAGTESSLFVPPAGAGTYTVYYYVVSADGADSASGSKQVVIEKASQKAPTSLTVQNETWKNAGNGMISGLKARTMEYRRIDNNGGSPVEPVTGLSVGDTITRPAADPIKFGHVFDNWYAGYTDDVYEFGSVVTGDLTITARWTAFEEGKMVTLPTTSKNIEESAFEEAGVKDREDP